MNVKSKALNLITLSFVFSLISIWSYAQCPDNMYSLGIGGSSYLFYNNPGTGDLCNLPLPNSIKIQDANGQCGQVNFIGSGSCLLDSGGGPPFIGKSFVENDVNCSAAQNIAPFIVEWIGCDCSYAGTFPNFTLIAVDCSGSSCVPGLVIPDTPVPTGLYQAANTIVSTGLVASNGGVDFEAGGTICLENGFTVAVTANFSADIVVCP